MTTALPKALSHFSWPGLLVVFGTLLLFAGLAWPQVVDARRNWSGQQAQEYTDASLALHQAAHSHDPADRGGHGHESSAEDPGHYQQELAAAQQRFAQIKQQLEEARDGPQNLGLLLKIGGGILTAMGALSLILQKANR